MLSRLLVIRPGAMGDLLLTLPVFQLFKRSFPSAEIHVVANPLYAPLALLSGFVASVEPFDSSFFTPLFSEAASIPPALLSYLAGFDAAVCYLDDRSGLLQRNLQRSGVERVVIFDPVPPQSCQVSSHLAGAFAPLGITGEVTPVRIRATPEHRSWALDLLSRSFGAPSPSFLAIHPGAGSPKKTWPLDRFVQVSMALCETRGLLTLLLTGPAEKDVRSKFQELARGLSIFHAASPPVDRLAALISLAALYIGNDSGPTHLAAALGVPTIALFGPTDPALWRPLGSQVEVISSSPACAPCSREDRLLCEKAKCMEEISTGMVLQAARRFLNLKEEQRS